MCWEARELGHVPTWAWLLRPATQWHWAKPGLPVLVVSWSQPGSLRRAPLAAVPRRNSVRMLPECMISQEQWAEHSPVSKDTSRASSACTTHMDHTHNSLPAIQTLPLTPQQHIVWHNPSHRNSMTHLQEPGEGAPLPLPQPDNLASSSRCWEWNHGLEAPLVKCGCVLSSSPGCKSCRFTDTALHYWNCKPHLYSRFIKHFPPTMDFLEDTYVTQKA